ncbi:hypothetical protein WJX77_006452 [Trebouxia sp. C0004]
MPAHAKVAAFHDLRFSSETLGLISLLQDHCADQYPKDSLPSLDIKVFIGVLTGSANTEQRHAVRKTWALEAKGHRVVFFSAVPRNETLFDLLRREAAEYQDVVVLPNIHESYFNITHQTLEMCRMAAMDPAVSHLLKVDDDSYVHVTKLIARLKALPREKMFAGYMEKTGGKPHRDPANRWHVPVEEWPWETYPAWAHGAGYVVTKDLVHEIAAGAAMKIQNHTLFRLEDISMGAWVEYVSKEKGWNVQLVKDKRFNFNGCLGNDLVSHYIQALQMRCMYKNNGKCCIDGKVVQPKVLARKGIT